MESDRDQLEMRCPRLGGSVSFHYCKTCSDDDLPCWKISDCWWETFDVMSYLRANLTEDQLQRFLEKKDQLQPKVSSLVELIEKARKNI